jgi:hypothetical protein
MDITKYIKKISEEIYNKNFGKIEFDKALYQLDKSILEACTVIADGRDSGDTSSYQLEDSLSDHQVLFLAVLIRFPSLLNDSNNPDSMLDSSEKRLQKIVSLLQVLYARDRLFYESLVPFLFTVRSIFGERYLLNDKESNEEDVFLFQLYLKAFPVRLRKVHGSIAEFLNLHFTFKCINQIQCQLDDPGIRMQKMFTVFAVDFYNSAKLREDIVEQLWQYNIDSAGTNDMWRNFEIILADTFILNDELQGDMYGLSRFTLPDIDSIMGKSSLEMGLLDYFLEEWEKYSESISTNESGMFEELFTFGLFWKYFLVNFFPKGFSGKAGQESRSELKQFVRSIAECRPDLYRYVLIQSPASVYPLESFPTALGYRTILSTSFTPGEVEYYFNVLGVLKESIARKGESMGLRDLYSFTNFIFAPILSYHLIQPDEVINSKRYPLLSLEMKDLLEDTGSFAISYGVVADVVREVKGRNGFNGEWYRALIYFLERDYPELIQDIDSVKMNNVGC